MTKRMMCFSSYLLIMLLSGSLGSPSVIRTRTLVESGETPAVLFSKSVSLKQMIIEISECQHGLETPIKVTVSPQELSTSNISGFFGSLQHELERFMCVGEARHVPFLIQSLHSASIFIFIEVKNFTGPI